MTFPDRHTHRYVSSAVQGHRDVTTSQPIIYRPAPQQRKGMHWTRRVLRAVEFGCDFTWGVFLAQWALGKMDAGVALPCVGTFLLVSLALFYHRTK